MEITHEETRGVVMITIKGRLDAVTAPSTEEAIRAILAEGHTRLLFDLSSLEYLSSDGLRIILGTAKHLSSTGGKMVLCALTDYVKEIFEFSRLTALFTITDTVDSGLREFE